MVQYAAECSPPSKMSWKKLSLAFNLSIETYPKSSLILYLSQIKIITVRICRWPSIPKEKNIFNFIANKTRNSQNWQHIFKIQQYDFPLDKNRKVKLLFALCPVAWSYSDYSQKTVTLAQNTEPWANSDSAPAGRPAELAVCCGPGCVFPPPSCMLPWHQTSARLSSSYLVLYTLVSEHENKMTFYQKV